MGTILIYFALYLLGGLSFFIILLVHIKKLKSRFKRKIDYYTSIRDFNKANKYHILINFLS